MKRRIVIILNPAACRGRAAGRRAELEYALSQAGEKFGHSDEIEWKILQTEVSGEAKFLAFRAALEEVDIVAAAGGDGTLSEVLNGLIGSDTRLGIIPMGTGNDFGRHLGITPDIKRSVGILLEGNSRRIDVGLMNTDKREDHLFINVSCCGFDAIVANRVNRGYRHLRGTTAYLAAALETLRSYRAAQFRIEVDGEIFERKAMLIAVANGSQYGGGMRIAPNSSLEDGLFDICILDEMGWAEFLLSFPSVFQGTHIRHPKVTILRGSSVRIETEPSLPISVDGELITSSPVEFQIIPDAIEFIIPVG